MLKFINLIFFGVMIVMNILANALPLNNKTTGELSDALPNLFVPAGLTFSIWGVIYLMIALFCIIQFRAANQAAVEKIGWLFALSCLFNALWIIAWHYQRIPVSLMIMILLLVSLIYLNLQIRDHPFGLIKAGFGVYLGWICIATIANVTALLVRYNWNGFGIAEPVWTIIMILTGVLIVSLALLRLNNPYIGLSVMWAFLGIYIKRQGDHRTIAFIALAAIVIVTIVTIYGFYRRKPAV